MLGNAVRMHYDASSSSNWLTSLEHKSFFTAWDVISRM